MTSLKVGKISGLKYFDINDIRLWNEQDRNDFSHYFSSDWRGTAVDILRNETIPYADRIKIVARPEIISRRVLRLFAVFCGFQVHHKLTNPRSIKALDVAEKFALGIASEGQRIEARDVAWEARCAAWPAPGADDRPFLALCTVYFVCTMNVIKASWAACATLSEWYHDEQKEKFIEMIITEGKERVNGKRLRKQI